MRALSLAEGAVNRDESAPDTARGDLAALYDEHAPAVYRLVIAMLGSSSDAQDAVSEVFLRAARCDFRRIRNPRAYLLASARHQAISMLRRRQRETLVDPLDSRFFHTARLDERQAFFAHRVAAALRELPAQQREVIVLKVYEQMTFAEIAAITKTPANTVASRYRYAVEKLRRALEE